jgi:beta-phosphoglucomutase
VIVSADDLSDYKDPEGINKPKPYIYLQAAKLLGLHPKQCAAIEDSRTGISSAVSAGCIAVAIPNAYTAQQDLSHAHLKVISFVDVTPNDFLQMIAKFKMSSTVSTYH